jgi:hypothetical protein
VISLSQNNDQRERTNTSNDELEKLKCNVEIWKKIVDVQQHFNTIEMQIRNFAVTILAGIIAAAGLSLRDPRTITFFDLSVSNASAILIGGIFVLISFYFMDKYWYHRLLQAAVNQGEKLETEIERALPGISLSQAIRAGSPVHNIRSNRKIDIFYGMIIIFLIVTALGVNNLENSASDGLQFDDAICEGNFSISVTGDEQNLCKGNEIHGYGVMEIRSHKSKRDVKNII